MLIGAERLGSTTFGLSCLSRTKVDFTSPQIKVALNTIVSQGWIKTSAYGWRAPAFRLQLPKLVLGIRNRSTEPHYLFRLSIVDPTTMGFRKVVCACHCVLLRISRWEQIFEDAIGHVGTPADRQRIQNFS